MYFSVEDKINQFIDDQLGNIQVKNVWEGWNTNKTFFEFLHVRLYSVVYM